jgi:hypothetical protein
LRVDGSKDEPEKEKRDYDSVDTERNEGVVTHESKKKFNSGNGDDKGSQETGAQKSEIIQGKSRRVVGHLKYRGRHHGRHGEEKGKFYDGRPSESQEKAAQNGRAGS